jgi:hypothetical protein
MQPEFREFLGGLADRYDTLNPTTKLTLVHRFNDQKRNGQPISPDEQARRELLFRYGSLENVERTGTAEDKLRLAHVTGRTAKEPAPMRLTMTPAIQKASPLRKLELAQAAGEYAKLLTSVRSMKASPRPTAADAGVIAYRAQEMDKRLKRMETIRSSYPELALTEPEL